MSQETPYTIIWKPDIERLSTDLDHFHEAYDWLNERMPGGILEESSVIEVAGQRQLVGRAWSWDHRNWIPTTVTLPEGDPLP